MTLLCSRLEKSELKRSIELSQRIMSTLAQMWKGITKKEGAVNDQNGAFEIAPFISQLARWVDKEVIAQRPKFVVVDIAKRLAGICLELQERGIAVKTAVVIGADAQIVPVWATAPAVDHRIGGAKVSHNERFTLPDYPKAALFDQFQKVIKRHVGRRLTAMLEIQEACFSTLQHERNENRLYRQ